MSRKKISPKNPPKKNSHAGDPNYLRYVFLTLLCGLILVGGFFVAARQHFSSIDLSIKNSRLKKQIDELETSRRRLQLEKEIALTPAEIKKAAKKIGLTQTSVNDKPSENPPAKKTDGGVKPEQTKADKTEEIKKEAVKTEKADKKPQKTEVKKDAPAASPAKETVLTRKRRADVKEFK